MAEDEDCLEEEVRGFTASLEADGTGDGDPKTLYEPVLALVAAETGLTTGKGAETRGVTDGVAFVVAAGAGAGAATGGAAGVAAGGAGAGAAGAGAAGAAEGAGVTTARSGVSLPGVKEPS
jgi:hypothetical protein